MHARPVNPVFRAGVDCRNASPPLRSPSGNTLIRARTRGRHLAAREQQRLPRIVAAYIRGEIERAKQYAGHIARGRDSGAYESFAD